VNAMTPSPDAERPTERDVFTNGKPRQATEADCKAPYGGLKNGRGFRCYLCGHRFAVGDIWRWVYCNDGSCPGGNFLVCESCDGPDVKDRRADWVRRFDWLFLEK
jgi:hypothetical protein